MKTSFAQICRIAVLAAVACISTVARGQGTAFDVLEFEVSGNTVLPASAIEQAVYPFLGPGRTIDDVEAARAALERAYRDAGYATVAVDIPEQRVQDGLIRLDVVEGRVSRVRVTGARYYDQGRILAGTPGLAEGAVLSAPDVQQQIVEINRGADRRVTPVLRPGATRGTTEVELQVADRSPLHGSVELNNRYSPNTTPLRLIGTLRYDNLWQREHSISAQYQTSPRDWSEVQVYSLAYTIPFEGGRFLTAYAIDSKSNVATAVASTTVLGAGRIYGARYTAQLPPWGDGYYHSLSLGADIKDFEDNLLQPGLPPLNTPLRYTPFMAGYNATMQGPKSVTTFGGSVNFTIRGVGSDSTDFENKRFKADSNYLLLRLDATHLMTLSGDVQVMLRADGQIASQPLVSNEQFYAGGIDSVRGYLEVTALGDSGARGSVELRSPQLASFVGSAVQELRATAFIDGAQLWVIDALPQQRETYTLVGAGFGLRLSAFRGLNARADVGWPFRDQFQTTAWQPRVQFIANYAF